MRLRWWIGTLLFLSTVINYIDRQTLSVLAPFLKKEYSWNNSDYAWIVIGFRLAYALGQTGFGRLLDRVGTRRGLTLAVTWYSCAAMVTSLASGLRSFTLCRFALGLGESGNWPGATKAVAEWFPKRERGWAVALFDSGSSVGAAVAPFLVLFLYQYFGTWRPAFLVTGTLGFAWLGLWLWSYHPPETHPRIGAAERDMILRDKQESGAQDRGPVASWGQLLRLPQTWGVILGKSLTDPIWFFVTDWFAIYLVSKKIPINEGILAFWIPFVAADLGNFFGGGVSSWLIKRGWPVGRARKAVIVGGGVGMALLAPAVLTSNVWLLAGLFGISTFAYAAWSTMGLVLPSDLYPSGTVATVSGMSGTGAGFGTILSTYLIGKISDRYSFEPILIAASLIPLVATAAVLLLVRNNRACDTGLVRRI